MGFDIFVVVIIDIRYGHCEALFLCTVYPE